MISPDATADAMAAVNAAIEADNIAIRKRFMQEVKTLTAAEVWS